MSAVSESIAQRVTLGMLVERYGFEVDPPFATNVTITSLSDAVDTVIPGSLFICTHEQEPDVLHAAQAGPVRMSRPLTQACPSSPNSCTCWAIRWR